MTVVEKKKLLEKARDQFIDEYPEWADYEVSITADDKFKVVRGGTELTAEAAEEFIRDLSRTLKDNDLMVVGMQGHTFVIDEYHYVVEDGLDDLADELELLVGKDISNLRVTSEGDKPKVKFQFIGNLTTEQKNKIVVDMKRIVDSYTSVDEEDAFADVEFEDFEDVMREVDEMKANDEQLYQVVVDDDAAVGYTLDELREAMTEDEISKLLAGETIEWTDPDGATYTVYIV